MPHLPVLTPPIEARRPHSGAPLRRALTMAVALLSVLALASTASPAIASAATVTVGSPLDAMFASDTVGGQATFANAALGEAGAHVNSPVTGVIVRWRVVQASGGPFTLRVLAPAGGGTYAGAGTSSPQTPTSTSVQTFSTSLPISAGDTIGLDNTNSTDHIGEFGTADSVWVYWLPQLQDGVAARRPPSATQTGEIAFNADVVAQPGITSIDPTSGPLAHGISVVIRGHDFSGATSVSFGGHPASGFTVDSDAQIVAVAPTSTTAGPVDVRVMTPGGTSPTSAADRFTYTACVVPQLKGKTLKNARKLLAAAHCSLGKVKKPNHGKRLVVKSQSPSPRTVLADGASVSVSLGPKPKRRHH